MAEFLFLRELSPLIIMTSFLSLSAGYSDLQYFSVYSSSIRQVLHLPALGRGGRLVHLSCLHRLDSTWGSTWALDHRRVSAAGMYSAQTLPISIFVLFLHVRMNPVPLSISFAEVEKVHNSNCRSGVSFRETIFRVHCAVYCYLDTCVCVLNMFTH